MTAQVLPYAQARDRFRDGDVVGVEGRGPISRAIRLGTGGTVTHVGVAWWIDGSLLMWHSREFRGAKYDRMSLTVADAGELLVYRPPPIRVGDSEIDHYLSHHNGWPQDLHRGRAWCTSQVGYPYNWRGIVRWGRRVLRRWTCLPQLPALEDSLRDGHRYCSQGASAAWRAIGRDLREDLADEETSPADLVASPQLGLAMRVRA